MLNLSRSPRPHRAGEWTQSKAVTFIVTLAASRSVTLAAAQAGMSRKSAYSLKRRNPAFAAGWDAAIAAVRDGRNQGDKVGKVHDPRMGRRHGDKAATLKSRTCDADARDRLFANLANRMGIRESQSLARARALP